MECAGERKKIVYMHKKEKKYIKTDRLDHCDYYTWRGKTCKHFARVNELVKLLTTASYRYI